jgi:multiple sugar transport system permease protein
MKHSRKKENRAGYIFVMPALIVFLVLVAFPFFFSIFLAFTQWNFLSGFKGIRMIGLDNFTMLLKDRRFRQAILNTFIYSAATVPVSIILSLVLAYLLNGKTYGKNILRLCFFIPYISSVVALAAVFKFLFRDDGIVNNVLVNLHFISAPLKWFSDPKLSRWPIIFLMIWTAVGYEVIIYIAALQNVSRSLYEAAQIDGGNAFQIFRSITVPLISPTTFYLVVVRLIATFKVFTSINIMTMGTAASMNTSMVTEIYSQAFSGYKFGYASAEALVLFLIIFIITRLNFLLQKKWVNY